MNVKKGIVLFLLIGLFFLGGCNNTEKVSNEKPTEEVKKIETWIKETIPSITNEDIVLPITHPELGGTIEWDSLTPEFLTSEGKKPQDGKSGDALLQYTITYTEKEETATASDVVLVQVVNPTFADISLRFENQFSPIINRDYNVKVDFDDNYTITWESSNTSVFTNEGKYVKPENNETININYVITFNGVEKSFSLEKVVEGKTFFEKVDEITSWINENYITEKEVDAAITLPTKYEKFNATITWTSSNVGVVSSDGKIKQFAFERYVTLLGNVQIGDYETNLEYNLVITPLTGLTEEQKLLSLLDAIAVSNLPRLTFTAYGDITQSYNFLPFYVNEKATVYEYFMNVGGSRPGEALESLEFVTIHDTANTASSADGLTHAKLLQNGYDRASWNFAIDETGAYQSIPVGEVAWHAGDGRNNFNLTDTGVKATVKYPTLTINEDGYYALNGVRSNIAAPKAGARLATTEDITPSGIYIEIRNGNYYINTTYYNTDYGYISNGGGNHNSVGIETCVNEGSDYATTLRHTAKLVAEILIQGNLSVDRVMQHNNFSGKPCPLAMRTTKYWYNFLDLVSLEKFAKTAFPDATFTWTSQSDILDNTGKIKEVIGNNTEVSYSVTVNYGTNSLTKQYTTKLNK